MAEVDVPRVEVTLPGQNNRVSVFVMEDFYRWLGDLPENADEHARAEAEFGTLQARWDDADRRIGYSRTRDAEVLAASQAAQHPAGRL